jgi:hypothetical protein
MFDSAGPQRRGHQLLGGPRMPGTLTATRVSRHETGRPKLAAESSGGLVCGGLSARRVVGVETVLDRAGVVVDEWGADDER